MTTLGNFDVIICGAGPAGCTTALALKNSGLKVALIDKQKFPRNKVCGDAIPAIAIKTLRSISPKLADDFSSYEKMLLTKHTDIKYGKRKLQLHWKIPAYTCPRIYFDNRLMEFVEELTTTTIFQETTVKDIEALPEKQGYRLTCKEGQILTAKILVGADGAQGVVTKKLTTYKLEREHHIASVRAYFNGVAGVESDKTEMFMNKDFLPGYFWIFPVADGMANVGFGMVSKDVAERKVNLKTAMYEFIEAVPELKHRFKNAKEEGKLEGHNLPAGSRRVAMSGDGFMLCGDAASLIDPITGEGIGNAMLSGKLAAHQAERCFKEGDFSANFISAYDDSVWAALGKELTLHANAQKLLRKVPVLINTAFALCSFEPVRRYVQRKF